MKKYAKSIILTLLAVVLLGLALWYVPVVEEIDRVMPAVEWSDKDEALCLATELTIRGKYYRYLFKDDYFIGNVSLQGFTLEPMMNTNPATGKPMYTRWSEKVKIIHKPNGSPFTQILLEWVGAPPSSTPPVSFHVATGTLGKPRYNKEGRLRTEDGRETHHLVVFPGLEQVLFTVGLPGKDFHYLSVPATTREEAVQLQDALLPIN